MPIVHRPSEPVVVGNTHLWILTPPTKDGLDWDLTGATITLTFRYKDAGTKKQYTFTSSTPAPEYINPTDTFHLPGDWQRSWKVVEAGTIVLQTREIDFPVYGSLSAA